MKRTRIGCVLMAAGNSTRFGGNKLLTDFFGKTLIERAMEAIPRDKLCRAAVVSQYDEALSMALDFDFLAVKNDRPEDGVSRTIRLGLDALGNVDAAMFMVAGSALPEPVEHGRPCELLFKGAGQDSRHGIRRPPGKPGNIPQGYVYRTARPYRRHGWQRGYM